MSIEYALVVIKPDGLSKGLAGKVLDRFLKTGLKLLAIKTVKVSQKLAEAHYGHLSQQPFYQQILDYLQGKLHKTDQVIVFVCAGKNAVKVSRKLAGATNPEEADPTSIRGAFGRIRTDGLYENVVHVSSDTEESVREIKLWFEPEEFAEAIFPVKTVKQVIEKKKVWK